jgi:phosphate transport system permease protein
VELYVSLSIILLILTAAAVAAFFIGLNKAKSLVRGSESELHSRPGYYGTYLALWTMLPALFVTIAWAIFQPVIIDRAVTSNIEQALQYQSGFRIDTDRSASEAKLELGVARSIAFGIEVFSPEELAAAKASPEEAQRLLQSKGIIVASPPARYLIEAAEYLNTLKAQGFIARVVTAFVLAVFGFLYGLRRIAPHLRARNAVERVVIAGLLAASTIAILTTAGIVLSVLFESLDFFSRVSAWSFFTGTVWDPRFAGAGEGTAEGQFGLLPLLWGTLFISFVAMCVAVPIGLLAAVYMAEYAHPRVRAVAKPALEILAGIPSIVYGFFALVTVGPFLVQTGNEIGIEIQQSSVLTAGFVMGIMIIPFVSSLSDDIITAVPRALREGSYGLGATQSETIKKVVLPAALPGIVGAILLAVSRAIGETMIVVLAAGIAANLTINPLESVTTITVKIVSQLTGDLEFDTPQTLVAFALGLTLFVITLGLNIYALYIVRKYREQYE